MLHTEDHKLVRSGDRWMLLDLGGAEAGAEAPPQSLILY